jgi:hypothetical protein
LVANKPDDEFKPVPASNYSSALARAVEWLGDRYLLAKPIKPSRRGTPSGVERISPADAAVTRSHEPVVPLAALQRSEGEQSLAFNTFVDGSHVKF